MKAIYYVRVSTGSQSFSRQIADIEKEANKLNYQLVTGFEETESGKIKVRHVLSEMEEWIEKNKVDFVIISELSRLGRTSKVLETIENLNSKGIGLVSLKENISTLNPDKSINHSSSLIISILSSINSYELETIKYRSISGIEKSVRSGNAGGALNWAYGYKKVEKKLLVCSEESKIIKRIFKLYLKGNGTGKISDILNKEGVLTRTQTIIRDATAEKNYNFGVRNWVSGTIYSILKNPIYIGQRRRKESVEVIDGRNKVNYELMNQPQLRIIDDLTFNKVQALLSSNYNKSNKHTKNNYLLEPKKIECGCCVRDRGVIRHYHPHKRESGKDNRYICLSKRYKENCCNVGIGIDKLEYTIQQIIFFLFQDKLVEKLDNKSLEKKIQELENELNEIQKELKKAKRKEGELIDYKLDDKISIDVFDDKIKKIRSLGNQLEIKMNLKGETKKELLSTYENMKDIKKLKLDFLKGQKIPKNIVNKIISKIIVTKQDTYPDIFKNKQDKVVELKIFSANEEYKFLISQREKLIYYHGFTLDMFLDDTPNADPKNEMYKKMFKFINDN